MPNAGIDVAITPTAIDAAMLKIIRITADTIAPIWLNFLLKKINGTDIIGNKRIGIASAKTSKKNPNEIYAAIVISTIATEIMIFKIKSVCDDKFFINFPPDCFYIIMITIRLLFLKNLRVAKSGIRKIIVAFYNFIENVFILI